MSSTADDDPVADVQGIDLDGVEVLVCVGSGGVGKTTTAAALAIVAADRGRRAVVITVDPARRLADALGLTGGLTDEPQKLTDTPAGGQLWAMMLDPRATFDRVVAAEASAQEAARIYANGLYNNFADGMSGTHNYLATEELFRLSNDDRFDLVVVDTPPSTTVLDIVDAPRRLVRLIDNRIYRVLSGRSTGVVGVMTKVANRFVRSLASVVGADVIEDAVEFFGLFKPLEQGFKNRALAVEELLAGDVTKVVLVTTPRPDVVATASSLAQDLEARSLMPDTVVVNMAHPDFGEDPAEFESDADVLAVTRLAHRVSAEHAAVQPLSQLIGVGRGGEMLWVPALSGDVHDTEGLQHVASHLGAGDYPL
ncbi:MAG: ArsA-related P-loop ATPase [Acidimicrobiales bacterium]|nr:ArsA family ATPase [Acidimicrobiales bacterium]